NERRAATSAASVSHLESALNLLTSRTAMPSAKHILVVEDERHLAMGIKFNLEGEGYRVTVAGSGPAALEAFQENEADVDLIILDIMLPGMSGYAVCESLRKEGSDVPILILSART